MIPLETSHFATASLEYSKTTESQENTLKTNFIKIIDILKHEINESFKEIKEKYFLNGRDQ